MRCLRLAGWLEGLAALVLCRPYDFTDEQTEQLHEALMGHLASWDCPVIARVEGGHTDPLPTFRSELPWKSTATRLCFRSPRSPTA